MSSQEEPVRLDAPNQQVVRADQSGPADEGQGGALPRQEAEPAGELEAMSKDDLLDYAQKLGVTPANKNMTKEELKAALEAHQGGG
jgi:hypothetical protein